MLFSIYRSLIPNSFRKKIYDLFLGNTLWFFRNIKPIVKSKMYYIFSPFIKKTEKNEAYIYMGKNRLTSYPFKTEQDYSVFSPEIYFDTEQQLQYLFHSDKKLFFPKSLSEKEIKELYRSLLIEQDRFSPHQYVSDFSVLKDRVLIDVGSAEGIFSLDTIELTREVFLFECEDYWIEALNATFAPWKEKVHIIKRYVSDINDTNNITLDTFCAEKKNLFPLFIKMDIEGAEQSALRGAKTLLQTCSDVMASVCTYHRENDAEEIDTFFKKLNYKTELTQGFLFWDKSLRRGLLRAIKNEK